MIKKFAVKNYKSFKDEMFFDFTDFRDYKFNTFAIKNGLIKAAILYGKNGSGKSNFGLALFDLITHLTDNQRSLEQSKNYINGDSDEELAEFTYNFLIGEYEIQYMYKKQNVDKLVYETLVINDQKVFSFNFTTQKGDFPGMNYINAESLKIGESMNISVLRYIVYNANLNNDNIIVKLMNFINNMLWFRTTTSVNEYIGFDNGNHILTESIIEADKVKEFEKYLNKNEVNYKLNVKKDHLGKNILVAEYKYKDYNFIETASNGTKALLLYFYWIQRLADASFVFIDEYDAFFHTFLAQDLFLEITKKNKSQIIITTHNTDLMSNNILRPDCYFIMFKGKIKSLPNCTERELREGHNLEKMFKGGEFGGR